jgi:hypothetical protein
MQIEARDERERHIAPEFHIDHPLPVGHSYVVGKTPSGDTMITHVGDVSTEAVSGTESAGGD